MKTLFKYWLVTPYTMTRQSHSKYIKYVFRFLANVKYNHEWVKYINTSPRMINFVQGHEANFYRRIQTKHISKQFNYAQKLNHLTTHYQWLFQHLHEHYDQTTEIPLFHYEFNFNQSNIDQESPQTIQPRPDSLTLIWQLKSQFYKEGESGLILKINDQIQYTLTFSYLMINNQPVFFIGGLQGGKQEVTNLENIKQLTKILYGLRPKQLLLHGLSVLCDFYQINQIIGISNQNHIYKGSHSPSQRARVKANLDEFWLEFQAKPNLDGNFILSPLPQQIDLNEIASKKRSQYRKRQLILDQLATQTQTQLQALRMPISHLKLSD